jgi:hypothetical protein
MEQKFDYRNLSDYPITEDDIPILWADLNTDISIGLDFSKALYIGGNTTQHVYKVFNPKTNEFAICKPQFQAAPYYKHSGNPQKYSYIYDPSFGSAQREAVFGELAHKVFGLGKYVPRSSVFLLNNVLYSAIKFVPGDLYKDLFPECPNFLKTDANTLQLLAVMDVVLGNSDRHAGNIIVEDGDIKLIDNSFAFDFSQTFGYYVPKYVRDDVCDKVYDKVLAKTVLDKIMSWDYRELREILKKRGAPEFIIDYTVCRLFAAKSWLSDTIMLSELLEKINNCKWNERSGKSLTTNAQSDTVKMADLPFLAIP